MNYYQNHKEQIKASVKRARDKMRAMIDELKVACIKCGYYKCKRALSYHHRDGEVKEFQIGRVLRDCRSKARVLAEIAKCDLLCSNCHMEVTCGSHNPGC